MDNFTHAFAGMVFAEIAVQLGRPNSERWRGAAYFASVFAQNAPDFDFIAAPLTGAGLGYLMHHRGHTHTILAALPFGLLTLAFFSLWARFRKLDYGREGWRALAVLSFIGPLIHISMDYSNNYGVHPFWPVANHWIYGDAVFIIEPFFWAFALPMLFFSAKYRLSKIFFALFAGGGLAAAWINPLMRAPNAVIFTAFMVAMIFIARRTAPEKRGIYAAAGWAGVTAIFIATSLWVDNKAKASFAQAFPKAVLHDLMETPLPGDPLCWSMIAVGVEGDQYVARTGSLGGDCRRGTPERTAPMRELNVEQNGVVWDGEYSTAVEDFRVMAKERCHAEVMLRFVRAPFWTMNDKGQPILGDLRYDREKGLGFAEIVLPDAGTPCPKRVPPWIPPRAQLLLAPAGGDAQ